MKRINGFSLTFDKLDEEADNFWSGSIKIASNYKSDNIYCACNADTIEKAIELCINGLKARYAASPEILGIDIKKKAK